MTHDDAFELLPWYVNATLGDSDRRAVADHVSTCQTCATEVSLLQHVRSASVEGREPAPASARLGQVLERVRSAKDAPLARVQSAKGVPLERARATRTRPSAAGGLWHATPRVVKLALAAQLVIVLGLTAWIGRGRQGSDVVTAAGGGANSDRAQVAIAFAPNVTEERLRRTVLDVGGTIVEGPSALGLYTIALDLPPDSVEAVARVLALLRGDTSIVRFAERVP